jgi:hypothetical protein
LSTSYFAKGKRKGAGWLRARTRHGHLATRIPRALHRELKLHGVSSDVPVMGFVVAAIEEKLGRRAKAPRAARGEK